jgi:protoporphyrin/coproporphyrin ferrochelatase
VSTYDALLVVSFGGPEKMDDVVPFLQNVLRGRNVPPERLREVAAHYEHFGGKSPINDQNRALIAAVEAEIQARGPALPVYWGNRNWHPFLVDTLRRMRDDGRRNALALVTSAFSSYSGCRQYREDIARAQEEVGPGAPRVDKLRVFYNHPGFVAANADRVRAAFATLPAERRDAAPLVFTAHSIPIAYARTSDYEAQLREACRLVAAAAGRGEWTLVYQSRSGPPGQPWLEPDVLAHLDALAAGGTKDVVVSPIGFVSDHMEVLYDLDTEAADRARRLGLGFVRAGTPGVHPAFVAMVRDLVVERDSGSAERVCLGERGPMPDVCASDCCPAVAGRPPVSGGAHADPAGRRSST